MGNQLILGGGLGGHRGMPALCQGPSCKPQDDRSLCLALSELIGMDQLSGRARIPALSLVRLWGGSQRQEVESLALRLGTPQLGLLRATQSQAVPSLLCVPRGRSVGIPALPAPPHHLLPSPQTYATAPHPANTTCSLWWATTPCLPG